MSPLSQPERIGETVLRILAIIGLLYLFILSITLLGSSFKLAGKEFAESIFSTTSNPMVGLMIGMLATAIIQSSSTTTSIIVGLVGTGFLSFENAIPMVMGANIGTTVTNLIVSLAHISRSGEFKRAFAGSVVHDFFNICAVIVLLPLQAYFNIIGESAKFIERLFEGYGGLEFSSPLAAITKPVAKWIIHITGDTAWIAAVLAIVLLFIALRYIVVVLKSMVLAKVERFFHRYIFRTPVLGLVLGIVLTAVVQSSSITTSLMVPLLGAGVVTISQVFPYMMGANIGTTVTAFLASFVTGSPEAVSLAFAHLLFNVYGMAIFWPLKKIPIWLAVKLADLTQRSKLIPILYIVVVFFLLPGIIILVMR
ncbi:MAG: Na/Pi symporter [candidate division Zixibacteria bacterium]|nr:Na/Pi symporter [candidate division Zixibacteria bacterium]